MNIKYYVLLTCKKWLCLSFREMSLIFIICREQTIRMHITAWENDRNDRNDWKFKSVCSSNQGWYLNFSFIIEASKPSFLKVLKTLCLLLRYIGMVKSILHIDVHFGLTDIGQFAKWPIYIVATMRMCKFEFSNTPLTSSKSKVMKGWSIYNNWYM